MKKQILMALAIACLPVIAMAAADFNGSWSRDKDKSEPAPYPLYWLTRGVDPGGGGQNNDYIITVKQEATKLQVTDPQRPLRTYELDGKARTVTADTGMVKASITAAMKGDTLVVSSTQPYGGMPGNVMTKVEEVWSLSADSKVLTITTTRDSPAAKQIHKEVYNRK